ncbi:hypothetical protein B0I37DRAFT_369050 [Chaetomium sp. MPI-CAGE-AT-0009]|nr:hypothetical protein B0I37DRAFT_369050 [Chaetomium sp. MPI-CAGE-AT-0009]
MSTTLITYLNYMSTWDSETEANIQKIIDEQQLFAGLGDFSSDAAIDAEFDVLTGLATTVRDETIAADAMQIAADAAAIAAIWSFGISMAAFVALEAGETIDRKLISDKSKELNDKLKTVDTDISAKINKNVNDYITQYKANNNLIASKAPSGLDTRTCRAILMQFMAQVDRDNVGKLNVAAFRKYAESARILYNSPEINQVYDALDKLNLSAKSDADVTQFLTFLKGLKIDTTVSTVLSIVRTVSIATMAYKLNISNKKIAACAKEAGLEAPEVESSAFAMMDAVGKFITVVAVAMSVVDTVLNIIDIVDVVEQTNEMCNKLNGSIKESYKEYFNGIKTSSKEYKAAIAAAAKS